jgi:hypothetical protein
MRHLILNFQERTSWKEHARTEAIEELSLQAEFAGSLMITTLSKDGDFYHQRGFYEKISAAEEFIHHLEEHLDDESTGFYFSPFAKKHLFPDFIPKLLSKIKKAFFKEKENLTIEERKNFIEIAYLFITLKLIDIFEPHFVSFASKDGLDLGGTTTVEFIALLSQILKKSWNQEEMERISTILFAPTLISRERVIHQDRFHILKQILELFEKKKASFDIFSDIYSKEILNYKIFI